MPTYYVELRRESFIVVTVEADNKEHAEEMAWKEVDTGDYGKVSDADWSIQLIEEQGV